ncbi:hypothetical protein [uncultured Serinicoccus sp.]|uniref:hypothetical protein n=1 Tax=uncultured Serinicoccus sp. TaxID=735514 RepID=UPI0026239783|nr:hypothetical protein [uncultured Serinicoccus sp.]
MFAHFEPVVLASDEPWQDDVFTGYAFEGSSLIIGGDGYRDWRQARDRALAPHEDGCYLHVRQTEGRLEVSGDFKGYCKVFVYQSGERWAVSNSFVQLVDAAKARGWPVTPNEHVLSTWSRTASFWQQLATFQTAAEQISLLPRQNVLMIDREGRITQKEGAQPHPEARRGPYGLALSRFLNVWIGRVGTCLRGDAVHLSTELSGGLDSRVTMSLILGLRQYFPVDLSRDFSVRSSPRYSVDLECAQRIAEVYRLSFNKAPDREKFRHVYVDPYERWRNFSLGSYAPHYWPARSHPQGYFKVGGHGGEGHRVYWPYESPHAVLERTAGAFASPDTLNRAREAFDETRDILARSYPGLPPTVAHYQEFRDRLHSGLHAQNTIRLQPLSSRHLYRVAQHSGAAALDRGQMLYDIMFQVAPGLAAMPYDKESKRPGAEVIRNAPGPLALNPMRGRVFGLSHDSYGPRRLEVSPWVRLRATYQDALNRIPRGLVANEVIEKAERAWRDVDQGRLKHSRDGAAIQHVVLAGVVTV